MRKLILTLLFAAAALGASAQKPGIDYDGVSRKFIAFYNATQYDSIFAMFDPAMKAALPVEKTNQFLSQLKEQLGKIKELKLIKYDLGGTVLYRTLFERGEGMLTLTMDIESRIAGMYLKPYVKPTTYSGRRNQSPMSFPLEGDWMTFWGGDTVHENYHLGHPGGGSRAMDLLVMDADLRSFRTDGKTNEDYLAFGRKVLAPCAGTVVVSVNNIPDNVPGVMNPLFPLGNAVIIKAAESEYVVLAHFKQNSVRVKVGDRVKPGDLLGLCGNSGNSSEAHLHLHIQDSDDYNTSTGIKCHFTALMVDGTLSKDHSPVRGERVAPAK